MEFLIPPQHNHSSHNYDSIVNEWSEIGEIYSKISINADYEIHKINKWYLEFKNELRNKIYNKIK